MERAEILVRRLRQANEQVFSRLPREVDKDVRAPIYPHSSIKLKTRDFAVTFDRAVFDRQSTMRQAVTFS